MRHTAHQASHRSPTAPNPAVPVRVSLAAAVLLPLVVLAVLHPGGLTAAGALLTGYLAGRHR